MANILTTGKLTPNVYPSQSPYQTMNQVIEQPASESSSIPISQYLVGKTVNVEGQDVKILSVGARPGDIVVNEDWKNYLTHTGILAFPTIPPQMIVLDSPEAAAAREQQILNVQYSKIMNLINQVLPSPISFTAPTITAEMIQGISIPNIGNVQLAKMNILPPSQAPIYYGSETIYGANAGLILEGRLPMPASLIPSASSQTPNQNAIKFVLENQPVNPFASFQTPEGIYGKMYKSESSPSFTYYGVEGYKGLTHALEEPIFFSKKPMMQDLLGTQPYVFSVSTSSGLAANIYQPQPKAAATKQQIDESKIYLETGYTKNPFTGDYFKLETTPSTFSFPSVSYIQEGGIGTNTSSFKPVFADTGIPIIDKTQAEYNLQLFLAQREYEKATPIEKLGFNIATLFSPKGGEYVGSYFTKETTPTNIILETMAQTRASGFNLPSFLKYEEGFLTGSPIGTFTLGTITGLTLTPVIALGGMTGTGAGILKALSSEWIIGATLGLAAVKPIVEYATGTPVYKVIGGGISEATGFAGGYLGYSVGQDLLKWETKPLEIKISSESEPFTNPQTMITTGKGTENAYAIQESELKFAGLTLAERNSYMKEVGGFAFINPIKELTRGAGASQSFIMTETKLLGGLYTSETGGYALSLTPDFKAFTKPTSDIIETFGIGKSATLSGENILFNVQSTRLLMTQIGEEPIMSWKIGTQEMQQVQREYTFNGAVFGARPEEFASFNKENFIMKDILPEGFITGAAKVTSTEPIMSMATGGRLLTSSFTSGETGLGGVAGGISSVFNTEDNILQEFKETTRITSTSLWSNFFPKPQKVNEITDYIVYPKGVTNIITATRQNLGQATRQNQNLINLLNQETGTATRQNQNQQQLQNQLQQQTQNQVQNQIISDVFVSPTPSTPSTSSEVTRQPPKITGEGFPLLSPPSEQGGRIKPIKIPSSEIYRKRTNPILELSQVEKIQRKILREW